MYRDGQTAELEALRVEVARAEAARAALARQREEALAELRRLKEGVETDPTLEVHPPYQRMRVALLALGFLGIFVVLVGLLPLLSWAIAEPLLTPQGVRNFCWHVAHGRGVLGIAATGFAVVVSLPWVALPFAARRGLAGERRWGWIAAVAGAVLFIPTPLMPLAAFALSVLLSRRVRAVYFPRAPKSDRGAVVE